MEKVNYATRLLENMQRRPRDFVIKAGNRSFPVHRNFISASSPYFDTMLESGMKEAGEGCVVLHDVEEVAAEICVNFMYTGQAEITLANVKGVLHAAHLMQLCELVNICIEFLKSNLNPQIWVEAIRMGRLYDKDDLVKQAEEYIVDNFETIVATESFPEMECSDLVGSLKKVSVGHELKWKSITAWVAGNDAMESCEEFIEKLAEACNIDQFPIKFLAHEVSSSEVLRRSPAAVKLVLEGMYGNNEKLERNIDVENCFILKNFAEESTIENLTNVIEIISKFMRKRFKSIAEDDGFTKLFFDEVKCLVSSVDTIATERSKLKAVLRWAKHDPARLEEFPELFERIRIEVIPSVLLLEKVEPEKVVMNSMRCKDHMLKSLMKRSNQSSVAELVQYIAEEPCIITYDEISGVIKVIFVNSKLECSLPRIRSLAVAPPTGQHQNSNGLRKSMIRHIAGKLEIFRENTWHALSMSGIWERQDYKTVSESDKSSLTKGVQFSCDSANYSYYATGKHYRVHASCSTQIGSQQPVRKVSIRRGEKDVPSRFSSYVPYFFFIEVNDSLMVTTNGVDYQHIKDAEDWQQASVSHARKVNAVKVPVAGKLYVVGGDRGIQDTIEIYDEHSNQWSIFHVMSEPAVGHLHALGHTPGEDL